MASSKTLMLLGLFLAIFLISAEVYARDLSEATQTQKDVQLDGYHHHYGHGGHHHGVSVHDEHEDGHHCHGHHCGGCHGRHCGGHHGHSEHN